MDSSGENDEPTESSELSLSNKVVDRAAGATNDHSQPSSFPLPSVPPWKRASITSLPAPPLSASSSANSSPKPSREPSPIRLPPKPISAAPSKGSRSRKNSQELSPSRGSASTIPTVLSAAAIQRALSAAGAPQLQLSSPANSDFSFDPTKTPRPSKTSSTGSGQFAHNISRVKSPPPVTGAHKASLYSSRKVDRTASTPSITLERSSPSTTGRGEGIDEGQEDNLVPAGMRTPLRGMNGTGPTLETVQESSLPATPAIGAGRGPPGGLLSLDDRPESISEDSVGEAVSKGTRTRPESGSESGGTTGTAATKDSKEPRKAGLASNSAKPHIVHNKKSFTQLLPAKGKTGSEGTVKNMTVETETVSTIPQVSLGGGAGERVGLGRAETAGSLRLKPSTETIRPRKDKKRVARKAPSLNAGTGGSFSRRFHHHHLHTRPSSPASTISLSTTSPTFSPSYVPNPNGSQQAGQPVARPSRQTRRSSGEEGRQDSEGMSRPSSAVLTHFRGRTASSKADIFEAKVASAVDEVNSSDSEETFVYESNPPEPLSARPYRYHSRTPSATSMVSQMEQYIKNRPDGHHSIAGKKSMKFAHNPYHTAGHPEPTDGTGRGTAHSGRTSVGNASHHHHIGRLGRGGATHPSLFDTDSPFPHASRPLRGAAAHVARFSPTTTGPRSPHMFRMPGSTKRSGEPISYDLEGEGADDERTPLISSIRSSRSRYSRRGVSGASRKGPSADHGGGPCCRRATAFLSLGSIFALLVGGIIIILFMCSEALYAVRVRSIRNVLASEQEIMLDLHVQAVNPNLIAVQINDMDVNIFAKSKHVGTNAMWRNGRHGVPEPAISPGGGGIWRGHLAPTDHHHSVSEPGYDGWDNVDEGTDPIDDPEVDSQTMLLGRIFHFDSPLIFDASPIRHNLFAAVGGVRLAHPGNKTEEGGTQRWEKVMQHDFELIIRGVLRYSTPITSRTLSASISGSVLVHPGDGEEKGGSGTSSVAAHLHGEQDNTQQPQGREHSGLLVRFIA